MSSDAEDATTVSPEHREDMRHLVLQMVQAVVTEPHEVRIDERTEEESTVYHVYVAPADIGHAIGKDGRVANAIRTVVKEAAKRQGVKAYLDVKGHPEAAQRELLTA